MQVFSIPRISHLSLKGMTKSVKFKSCHQAFYVRRDVFLDEMNSNQSVTENVIQVLPKYNTAENTVAAAVGFHKYFFGTYALKYLIADDRSHLPSTDIHFLPNRL